MSVYWKQSLWIGGIYWLVSLFFKASETLTAFQIDASFSVILLLFLIAMNWLKPIKRIEQAMQRSPLLSTMLVSVGWVPYFTGLTIVVASIAAVVIIGTNEAYENKLFYLLQGVVIAEQIRTWVMLLCVFAALISVLAFKKSVAGCLDKNFRVTGGDACDMRTLDKPAAASAKNMYACKEKVKEETVEVKAVKKSAPQAKKKVVKATVKADKPKTGKKTAAKSTAKKKAGSSVKKAPVKKVADKK